MKDNKTCEIMLMHLEHIQQVYRENSMGATVPFTGMLHINDIEDNDGDVSIGSIGGDASGRLWCVINHRTNKMLIIFKLMPHTLVEVIGNRSTLLKGDIRRTFMISIAEHLVLNIALLQWGQEWKDEGTQVVRYMTDNQNSYVWTTKGFAGCEVAQDLCRLMSVLELIFGIKTLPGYINTKINVIADYGSRIYLQDGSIDYHAKLEFEAENKKLDVPYVLEEECMAVQQLVSHFAYIPCLFGLGQVLELQIDDAQHTHIAMGTAEFIAAETTVDLAREQVCGGIMRIMQDQGSVQSTEFSTAVPVMPVKTIMASELEQSREGWTIDQAKAWCRSDEPAWSVGFIGPSANAASMGVTAKIWL